MGKFKNQDGLRKPPGCPPNVTEKKNKKVETRTHSKKTELNQTKVATTQNKMKKVMTIFGAIGIAVLMLTSCGGEKKESTEESKPEGKWEKLAEINGLAKEDVDKAIEIGTKMSDCYQLESAPGAFDSKMTEACDPFMKEYKDYCVMKFGTDEWSGASPENKKNEAFREIMFDTRDDLAKSKAK